MSMIKELVANYMANKTQLRAHFEGLAEPVSEYKQLVEATIKYALNPDYDYDLPCADRITEIGGDNYAGTLIYVIRGDVYSEDLSWYVRISYGSCSGCDTLQRINDYEDNTSSQMVDDYMTLCLHIVQRMRAMDGDIA